jgi:hypothetical protein
MLSAGWTLEGELDVRAHGSAPDHSVGSGRDRGTVQSLDRAHGRIFGLEVFIGLLVLLLLTRVLGEVAERLRQPASVGELLAGIVLAGIIGFYGRDVPYMVELARSDALEYVANAGIFFLVLSAGIEMEPREIARHSGASFAVAFGGLIVPMLAGIALAWLFLPDSELKSTQASRPRSRCSRKWACFTRGWARR